MAKSNRLRQTKNDWMVPTMDVQGNAAAHTCCNCGGAYVVSAYCNRRDHHIYQGWRICPHCTGSEATIWYDHDDMESGRPIYLTDQRRLTAAEQAKALTMSRTDTGNIRLDDDWMKGVA